MTIDHRGKALILLCFLLCAILTTSGCGKKVWPEPRTAEESFSWHNATARLEAGCLEVQSTLKGNIQNLDSVIVEYEPLGEQGGCLSCPFQARGWQELTIASPQLKRQGSRLEMAVCGLDPSLEYRWRLVGRNIHPLIDNAVSALGVATRDSIEAGE